MASLLEQLIEALRVLPGVGPKSAQRMAYHVLERERDGGRRLGEALAQVAQIPVSLKSRQRAQWPIFSTATPSASARRRPPSRSRSSTW